MKKFLLGMSLFILLIIGGFLWLLSEASPENAPSGPVVIDLLAPTN